MEKQIKILENGNVKIGEVVLTDSALEILDRLQEESNAYINETLAVLGNAVCFLAKTKIHWAGSWVQESESLIQQLSFVHRIFNDLKVPTENKLPQKFDETATRDFNTK